MTTSQFSYLTLSDLSANNHKTLGAEAYRKKCKKDDVKLQVFQIRLKHQIQLK
jgi:hypothetical protein